MVGGLASRPALAGPDQLKHRNASIREILGLPKSGVVHTASKKFVSKCVIRLVLIRLLSSKSSWASTMGTEG